MADGQEESQIAARDDKKQLSRGSHDELINWWIGEFYKTEANFFTPCTGNGLFARQVIITPWDLQVGSVDRERECECYFARGCCTV